MKTIDIDKLVQIFLDGFVSGYATALFEHSDKVKTPEEAREWSRTFTSVAAHDPDLIEGIKETVLEQLQGINGEDRLIIADMQIGRDS